MKFKSIILITISLLLCAAASHAQRAAGIRGFGAGPGAAEAASCIRQNSDRAVFTNAAWPDANSTQKLFDTTTNGRLTIATGSYKLTAMLYLAGMSATSGNGMFDPEGSGTVTAVNYSIHVIGRDIDPDGTAATITGSWWTTAQDGPMPAVGSNMVTASVAASMVAIIDGTFKVTVAGTMIPSYAMKTAQANSTLKAGSWLCIEKIPDTYSGAWD